MENYYHYIRLDADGWIIKSFSSAFEQPLPTDILYDTSQDRHFNMVLYNENRRLYKKWVDGGIVQQEKPKTLEEKMIPIRAERDRRLKITDYIITRHTEQTRLVSLGRLAQTSITDAKYVLVILYRQQLRDLPATVDIDNPIYPTQPEV